MSISALVPRRETDLFRHDSTSSLESIESFADPINGPRRWSTHNQSASDATESLWERAHKELQKAERKSSKLLAKYSARHRSTISDTLRKAKEKEKEMAKRDIRIAGVNFAPIFASISDNITKVLEHIQASGKIAAQGDAIHVGLPWAAVDFFLTVTINALKADSILVRGMETVCDLIWRYLQIEDVYFFGASPLCPQSSPEAEHLKRRMVELYTVVLSFQAKVVYYYTVSKTRRTLHAAFSKGTEDLLGRMKLHDAELGQSVRIVGEKFSRIELHDIGDTLQRSIAALHRSHARQHQFQMNREMQISSDELKNEILNWISESPFNDHHQTVRRGCYPEIGSWLFNHRTFKTWRHSPRSSILWVHGPPGAGKTYLASSAIENLRNERENECVAWFYCVNRSGEPLREDPEELLRSVLRQLCRMDETQSITNAFKDQYRESREAANQDHSRPPKLSIEDTARHIVHRLRDKSAIIVIDALDECSERYKLLTAFKDIYDKCFMEERLRPVKIIVTSRYDDNLAQRMAMFSAKSIKITNNQDDLVQFVKLEVTRAIETQSLLLGNVPSDVKEQIIQGIINRAEGTLQVAALQLKCVQQAISVEDVMYELSRLPEGLKDSYSRLHERITRSKPSMEKTKRALRWLFCAQHPLAPKDFLAAISGDSQTSLAVHQLLNMCNHLIVLDNESDPDDKSNYFRFRHATISEYLTEDEDYSLPNANRAVAERCLDAITTPTSEVNSGFRTYATLYWAEHCQQAQLNDPDGQLERRIQAFLLDRGTCAPSKSFLDWLREWSSIVRDQPGVSDQGEVQRSKIQDVFSYPHNPLFMASAFGFTWVLDRLAKLPRVGRLKHYTRSMGSRGSASHVDWKQRTLKGETALHLAVRNGHEKVVRFLLCQSIGIDKVDSKDSRTALHIASIWGREHLVRLLLKENASHKTRDSFGLTPLLLASMHGHVGIMECLLQEGADVETIETFSRHDLTEWLRGAIGAAQNDHQATGLTSKQLQEARPGPETLTAQRQRRGVFVMKFWAYQRRPIHYASLCGHTEVIELLLKNRAEVDAMYESYEPGTGKTALMCAVEFGYKRAAEILVRNGAAVNTRDIRGQCVIHMAAQSGNRAILEMLLEKGADVDMGCLGTEHQFFLGSRTVYYTKGTTPLMMAAKESKKDAVAILLEHGAKVNAKNGNGDTALHIAIQKGQRHIVKLMIEFGANPKLKDGNGRTAVDLADQYQSHGSNDKAKENRQKLYLWLTNIGADAIDELADFWHRLSPEDGAGTMEPTIPPADSSSADHVADEVAADQTLSSESLGRTEEVAPPTMPPEAEAEAENTRPGEAAESSPAPRSPSHRTSP